MVDTATETTLNRRRLVKRLAIPLAFAAAGLALKFFLGWTPVNAAFEWLLKLLNNPDALKLAPQWVQLLAGWAAGPIALFVLLWGVVHWGPVQRMIDRIAPDPPDFVRTDLDAARQGALHLLDTMVPPLAGRVQEQTLLAAMLPESRNGRPFEWRTVHAPSGTGKSRLGIEWLALARDRKWDFGIADPNDFGRLRHWKPRRPTALVIDEARRSWAEEGLLDDALTHLAKVASRKRPVRLLLLAQAPIFAAGAAPQKARSGEQSALHLQPLTDAALTNLANSLTDDPVRAHIVEQESAGRPRAAIILAQARTAETFNGALAEWAQRIVPQLREYGGDVDASLALGVAASLLAGPLPTHVLTAAYAEFSVSALLPLFEEATRASLETQIPAFAPEDLGQELALRLLTALPPGLRAALITELHAHDADRLEAGLGKLWADRFDFTDKIGFDEEPFTGLMAAQRAFDEVAPERVERRQAEAQTCFSSSQHQIEGTTVRKNIDSLNRFVKLYPFDCLVVDNYLGSSVNVIGRNSLPHEFSSLEIKNISENTWAVGSHSAWRTHNHVLTETIKCAISTTYIFDERNIDDSFDLWFERISTYFERTSKSEEQYILVIRVAINVTKGLEGASCHKLLNDVGSWVCALIDNGPFADQPQLLSEAAQVALNILDELGRAGLPEACHTWYNHVETWNAKPEMADHFEFQLYRTGCTQNLATAYRYAHQLTEFETWGRRLMVLADRPLLADAVQAKHYVLTHYINAVNFYGDLKLWDRIEAHTALIDQIAGDSRFANVPKIRLSEAKLAANAFNSYRYNDLPEQAARWEERFDAILRLPIWAGDQEILSQEARFIQNCVFHCSRLGDINNLERWSYRLVALLRRADLDVAAEVRERLARAMYEGIDAYRKAGITDGEASSAWRDRLAWLANKYPSDQVVQQQAAPFGLSAVDNLRRRTAPVG